MRLGWASKCPPEHEKEESDGLEPPESPVRGGVVGWRLTLLGGVGLDRVLCLPPSLLLHQAAHSLSVEGGIA